MSGSFARSLRADLFCASRSRLLPLMPIGYAMLVVMDSVDEFAAVLRGVARDDVWYFYFQSLSYGGLFGPYLGAMLCALPYARAMARERRWGVDRQTRPRTEVGMYGLSKLLTASLLGGLVAALGIGMLVIALRMIGLPYASRDTLEGMRSFCYFSLLETNGWRYFAVAACFALFEGGLFGGVGALTACYTDSEQAVVVAPMIARFVWIRVCQLFRVPEAYRLDRYLTMRAMPPGFSMGQAFALCAAACALMLAAMALAVWRRERQAMRHA